MTRFSVGIMALSALSFFLSLPCEARSKLAPEVRPPSTGARIYLGESGGYRIALSMPSPRFAVLYAYRFADAVALESGNAPETISQSGYAVRVDPDLLEKGIVRAEFPSLGKISLRFRPNGRRRAHGPGDRCHGKPLMTEYGVFRGTASLKGEAGYFEVSTRSAAGELTRVPRAICREAAGKQDDAADPRWELVAPSLGFDYSPGNGSIALLYAASRTPQRTIGMRVAHREGAPPGAEVQLVVLERLDGMAVGRSLYAEGEVPGTLATSSPGEHPASATFKPPAPFQGEGIYLENSSTSHSWTGDLAVSLPGLDLPLTGPGFKTSLCVVSPLKNPIGCDFRRPKLVGDGGSDE